MGLGLALLQFPDLLLDGSGGDQTVGDHGAGLANAMGAVDGLRFDGRVPPGVIEDDIAGRGQVEARAGGAQAQEEDARLAVVLEFLDDVLAFLGGAGQQVGRNLALDALALRGA